MKNGGFIFEGIRQWLVINLVTLIHGYSYLVSLEIITGYKKLTGFPGTHFNLSISLEKPDITYCGIFNTKSLELSCRISPKTFDHAENILFHWVPQTFPNITGIKSLYDRGRKVIHLLAGEVWFWTGETISANLSTGEATVVHLTGTLG